MSVFGKTALIGSMLGLFFLVACDNATGPGSTNAMGTWKGKVADSTMTLVIVNDSTFTGILPDSIGTYALSGKYSLIGGTITLNYASSLLGTEGIPPPSPNPATGTISGNKMTIPVPYNYSGDSVALIKQ